MIGASLSDPRKETIVRNALKNLYQISRRNGARNVYDRIPLYEVPEGNDQNGGMIGMDEETKPKDKCNHKNMLCQGEHKVHAEYCEICDVITRIFTYDEENESREWIPKPKGENES